MHGLFGNPRATWTGAKLEASSAPTNSANVTPVRTAGVGEGAATKSKGVFWPSELLGTAIPNINIHTWGYDADIDGFWSSASQNTVAQHAANLTSDLADLLESDGTEPLPIVFVVHSLGGLVVKAVSVAFVCRTTHSAAILMRLGIESISRNERNQTKRRGRSRPWHHVSWNTASWFGKRLDWETCISYYYGRDKAPES